MTNINHLLGKSLEAYRDEEEAELVKELLSVMLIEFRTANKSGIYGTTQKLMAYNSNRIEGSTLTPDQTAFLFETGTICAAKAGEIYHPKDVDEMRGHFRMFNFLLTTIEEPLSESLIKSIHYNLKNGVFEDIANGYKMGEYKSRENYVGNIKTALPNRVSEEMAELMGWYQSAAKNLETMAHFHAWFENIHPFQDGNGRTGRAILFRECLRHGILPVIVQDQTKAEYIFALNQAQTSDNSQSLVAYFRSEQGWYLEIVQRMLYDYSDEASDAMAGHSVSEETNEIAKKYLKRSSDNL